jgi:tyrosine-protein phosphatase SIW14
MKTTLFLAFIMSSLLVGCVNRGGGLHNFGIAGEGVYRGAQPSTNAIRTLAGLGVKVVIDLTDGGETHTWEPRYCSLMGMAHFNIPMSGLGTPTKKQVNDCLNLIRTVKGPVYVHCVYGSDRTSAIIAAWKRQRYQMTQEELLAEADTYGLEVQTIQNFILQLP